jgi:hypothetical protein
LVPVQSSLNQENVVFQKLLASVAFVLITFAAATDARAIPLDNLAEGGTLTSGNGILTFSDFEVITSGSVRSDLGLYDVRALSDGIAITGPFAARRGNIGDMFIAFTVTSTSAITEARLRFNGAAAGPKASASVTESFEELEDADLFVYSAGRRDRDLVDSTTIPGLTSLRVSKDILVDSGPRRDVTVEELEKLGIPKKQWKKRGRGIAVISRIEQRYTTPEPTSMVLLGAALLGIAAVRRNLQ